MKILIKSDSNNKHFDQKEIISIAFSIINYIIGAFTEPLYAHVDNFNISLIINGMYSEDNYTYYLHPWLCKLLREISNIFPKADAYVLLMHILLLGALTILYMLMLESKKQN